MQAKIYTADQLLHKQLPERKPVLELIAAPDGERTIISAGNIVEIVAGTGVGKTMFTMGLSLALATGRRFLHFKATEPRKVLYVDGEMASQSIQNRLKGMMSTMGITTTNHNHAFLSQDLQDHTIPRLDDGGSRLVDPFLDWANWDDKSEANIHNQDESPAWLKWGASVIILDNAACLFNPASEMDIEAWDKAQRWLLSLRNRGITVILLHHMGREAGRARGISAREDALDVMLHLKGDPAYKEGSRFTVTFAKGRDLYGLAQSPFQAWYHKTSGWGFRLGLKSSPNRIVPEFDETLLKHIITHDPRRRCSRNHLRTWVKGGKDKVDEIVAGMLAAKLLVDGPTGLQVTNSGEMVLECAAKARVEVTRPLDSDLMDQTEEIEE